MLKNDLTKSELVQVLEIIEEARSCVDRPELRRLILKASALMEADHSVCGIINTSALGPVALQDALNGSYPEKMFEHYIESKFFLKDPIVKYHANFSNTRSWSEIFSEMNDEQGRQVVEYARDFGLRDGISSSLFLPEEQGIFITSFAGPDKRSWAHQKAIEDILISHLGNAMRRCALHVPIVSGTETVAGALVC